MKAPQRRFVVEFKSGRRQPKARSKSIWGDTDLKALAREVEEKASHLFNSDEAAGMPASVETAPADPINPQSVKERADDADTVAVPFANGAKVEISKHHQADHSAEVIVQVQESPPARLLSASRVASSSREIGSSTAPVCALPSSCPTSELRATVCAGARFRGVPVDVVRGCGRLKRLLAEQLRSQNLWLKKMLERFDSE
ncbi:hypothetical protein [Sinorhizobium medicae]|uniref:hypothetical protein n=1 Tax=Sinorhizobium medicae TaxID=110321 RepID=UPI000414F218|nr:hypothetical protein [Sinorhizobium medicae]